MIAAAGNTRGEAQNHSSCAIPILIPIPVLFPVMERDHLFANCVASNHALINQSAEDADMVNPTTTNPTPVQLRQPTLSIEGTSKAIGTFALCLDRLTLAQAGVPLSAIASAS